jgi:hypothetical protein
MLSSDAMPNSPSPCNTRRKLTKESITVRFTPSYDVSPDFEVPGSVVVGVPVRRKVCICHFTINVEVTECKVFRVQSLQRAGALGVL